MAEPLPLFPLGHTVLFPGVVLPLHVFEERYRALARDCLAGDREFGDDRWCHDPELTAQFAPRHNTGVIFLNSNRGFHGPRGIRRLAGRRRWLYFTISSRVDVWPALPRAA